MSDPIAQSKHLRNLIAYAAQNARFYQRRFGDVLDLIDNTDTFDEWYRHLPVVTKADVRRFGETMLSKTYHSEGLVAEYTSGSTGIPLRCYKSLAERVQLAISLWKRRQVWSSEVFHARAANFWNTTNQIALSEDDRRTLSLSSCCLGTETVENYLSILEGHQPQWLYGTPSTLYKLARLISCSRRPRIKLTHIEVASEYLNESQRGFIQEIFDVPVVNNYGCREVWTIAYECPSHHLHLLEDQVYVEVCQDGQPRPIGLSGDLIVTALWLRAMPFIRYQLGDTGVISPEVPSCGGSGRVLTLLGGRTGMVLQVNGRSASSTLLLRTMASRLIQRELAGVVQFQLVQLEVGCFEMYIVSNGNCSGGVERAVWEVLTGYLGSDIQLRVNFVDYIVQNSAGKTPDFVSLIDS